MRDFFFIWMRCGSVTDVVAAAYWNWQFFIINSNSSRQLICVRSFVVNTKIKCIADMIGLICNKHSDTYFSSDLTYRTLNKFTGKTCVSSHISSNRFFVVRAESILALPLLWSCRIISIVSVITFIQFVWDIGYFFHFPKRNLKLTVCIVILSWGIISQNCSHRSLIFHLSCK